MENSNVLHIPDPSYSPYDYSSLADHPVNQSTALQATYAIIILFILSPVEAVYFPQDNIFIICMNIRDFLFHRTLLCFMRPVPIIHGNTSGLE